MHLQPDEAARLLAIEEIVKRIEKRLFGNGQPGELDIMKKQIASLLNTRARLLGAISILSFLLMATGGTLITHIIQHH